VADVQERPTAALCDDRVMKVAVWHYLPSGGGKRALYDHVRGLLERGHHVESWCPPGADQQFLPMGDLVIEHVVPMAEHDAGTSHRALSLATNGASRTFLRLRAFDDHTRRCAQEIDEGRFDVLLAASSRHVAASPIGRHVRTPSVLYLQEPARLLYEASPRLPWAALPPGRSPLAALRRLRDAVGVRAMRIQVREELINVNAFDRLLANSYFSRESMLRAYGVEARVCYLGIDTNRYVDRGQPRQRLVVGLGAYSPHKRVDIAIEAVAALPSAGAHLTWIGDRAEPAYLRGLVELARRRDVSFEPLVGVAHDRVVDVLNEAAVMVYAPRLEPFGYAPLEAAACGLPVVARAEGGVRESVVDGETGLLVDHDEALAPAIARLLDDESLARRMRVAARAHVEKTWTVEAAVDRLEAELVDVVERRRGRR
jgi:glycosyltransferase involved in cell wall biosynthesis